MLASAATSSDTQTGHNTQTNTPSQAHFPQTTFLQASIRSALSTAQLLPAAPPKHATPSQARFHKQHCYQRQSYQHSATTIIPPTARTIPRQWRLEPSDDEKLTELKLNKKLQPFKTKAKAEAETAIAPSQAEQAATTSAPSDGPPDVPTKSLPAQIANMSHSE